MILIDVEDPPKSGESSWPIDRIANAIASSLLEDDVSGPALRLGGEAIVGLRMDTLRQAAHCSILVHDARGEMRLPAGRTYRIANEILAMSRYRVNGPGSTVHVRAIPSSTLRAASKDQRSASGREDREAAAVRVDAAIEESP